MCVVYRIVSRWQKRCVDSLVLLSAASFPIGDLAEPRVTTNFLTLFDIIIIIIIQCKLTSSSSAGEHVWICGFGALILVRRVSACNFFWVFFSHLSLFPVKRLNDSDSLTRRIRRENSAKKIPCCSFYMSLIRSLVVLGTATGIWKKVIVTKMIVFCRGINA